MRAESPLGFTNLEMVTRFLVTVHLVETRTTFSPGKNSHKGRFPGAGEKRLHFAPFLGRYSPWNTGWGNLRFPGSLINLDPVCSCSHTCLWMLPDPTRRHFSLGDRVNRRYSEVSGESIHVGSDYAEELDLL